MNRDKNYEEIKELISKEIPQKRYQHTLGVIEAAEKLAQLYQVDVARTKLAALLHDCARGMSGRELLDFCQTHGIEVDSITKSMPDLLHGPVGAVLAQNKYNVNDKEILQAVAVHTMGDVELNDIAKILIIADAIEPGRNYPGIEKLRAEVASCQDNLNQAVIYCLEHKIQFVLKSKCLLHPVAVDARNYLLLNS